MSVNDTIRQALQAAAQARKDGGSVIVCLCGTWPVKEGAEVCPNCGRKLKSAE
jgi:hypothetical protein